jgi:hypothetical protein
MSTAMPKSPVEVFFSYAHADAALRDELEKHLAILQRDRIISSWHDRQLIPGSEWDQEIKTQLRQAQIILLLVSPDFIASDYCWGIEVKQAMEQHRAGKSCVIPIILRHADWQGTPFGALTALPNNIKPVKTWEDRDEAFLNITRGIRRAIENLAPPPDPHSELTLLQQAVITARSTRDLERTLHQTDGFLSQYPQHVEGKLLKQQIQSALLLEQRRQMPPVASIHPSYMPSPPSRSRGVSWRRIWVPLALIFGVWLFLGVAIDRQLLGEIPSSRICEMLILLGGVGGVLSELLGCWIGQKIGAIRSDQILLRVGIGAIGGSVGGWLICQSGTWVTSMDSREMQLGLAIGLLMVGFNLWRVKTQA